MGSLCYQLKCLWQIIKKNYLSYYIGIVTQSYKRIEEILIEILYSHRFNVGNIFNLIVQILQFILISYIKAADTKIPKNVPLFIIIDIFINLIHLHCTKSLFCTLNLFL